MSQIFAHRGLHVHERENTLEAFQAAKDLGVDGIEFDVRRTLDGRLVIHHDPVADRRVIARSLASQLPAHVASLADALEVCRGVSINVEIKNIRHATEPTYDASGEFATQVVTMVHEASLSHAVIFSCFDFATCVAVRSMSPSLRVGWLLDWSKSTSRAIARAHDAGLDAVHPAHGRLSATSRERARTLGLAVNVWTPNSPHDIGAMAALGVDAIITDDPATALVLTRP